MTLFHKYFLRVTLRVAANHNTRVRYRIEFLYRQTQQIHVRDSDSTLHKVFEWY